MIAQRRPHCGAETGDVGAGRPDTQGERHPPVLERREFQGDGQPGLDRLGQPGRPTQLDQLAGTGPGQPRLARRGRITITHRPPEERQRSGVAGVVPDAGADDPTGPGDPLHLGQPGDRVGHEMDDQLREADIEGGVGKR